MQGFNIAATNVHLILLPVMLDVLLWLSPRLGVAQLLTPTLGELAALILKAVPADKVEAVTQYFAQSQADLEQLNLLSQLSTFPVGVPTLLPLTDFKSAPYGTPLTIQLGGVLPLVGGAVFFIIVGWLLGSLYFGAVARVASDSAEPFSLRTSVRHFIQVAALSLLLLGLTLLVVTPGSLLASALMFTAPMLAQFLMFFTIFMVVWLIIPLLFSPLGIFTHQMNAITALLNSWRLMRFYLPTGGMFIMIAAVLGLGLDMLWRVPGTASWLLVVGILGHAFIYTALIAAAFVFFRGGMKVMQSRQSLRPPIERPLLKL